MAWRLGLRAIFLACVLSYCIAPVNSFTLDQNNAFRNYWRQYRSRTPLDYSRQYVEPLRFNRDPVLRNPYSATEQNLNVWPWNLSPRVRKRIFRSFFIKRNNLNFLCGWCIDKQFVDRYYREFNH